MSSMSKILNLGVLAHVDAGKTSLTERLLFAGGAIPTLGRVEAGNTHTDTLLLEQQRGITIRAAVASLAIGDCHINLIDTPGHPDFIAEVERSLAVLDAVILVVSSVEGVQPQTRRLARAIRTIGLPCIIFCNKIDRMGAREESLLTEITSKLGWDVVTLTTTSEIGTRTAGSHPRDVCDDTIITAIAEHDDQLLETWLESPSDVSRDLVHACMLQAVRDANLMPVIFGSAVTGAGIDSLLALLPELAPETDQPDASLSAEVFKIDHDRKGERVVLLRIWGGELRSREEYDLHREGVVGPIHGGKITRLERCVPGGNELAAKVAAGNIVRASGLAAAQIGDVIGETPHDQRRFFKPVFETVVKEQRRNQQFALRQALVDLADQDPFISLRLDARTGTTSIRLFGEVQKEVIEDALVNQYDVPVIFEESTVICIERPLGEGAAIERITASENPFAAGVGLTVRPGSPGSGVRYIRRQQALGRLPHAMYVGIEETVLTTLREGLLGWEVVDIEIELTFVEYWDPVTVVGDFRSLTPLVLMAALQQAGTEVCEPLHQFRLVVPEDCLAAAVRLLMHGRAIIAESVIEGDNAVITGEMPAVEMPVVERQLSGISRGEGDMDYWQTGWQRIADAPPSRARTDHNPLDRAEYVSRLSGRM